MRITASSAFGYHSTNGIIGKKYKKLNLANAAGYLFGPIIGIIRAIIFAYLCCTKKITDFHLAQIARGVMEIFCFSIILAAIDIFVTARRYHLCCC